MGIEFLFYELVPLYVEELPTDIVHQWRPQQIIHALIDCDPEVENDNTITAYEIAADGGIGKPIIQLRTKGVSKRLIKDYWHKLGSFLHAPLEKDKDLDHDTIGFLHSVIESLRAYDVRQAISNISSHISFRCVCGRTIKRKTEALRLKSRVICPDSKCRAEYEYHEDDKGAHFGHLVTIFTCPDCSSEFSVGKERIKEGLVVACEKCKCNCRIEVGFCLTRTIA